MTTLQSKRKQHYSQSEKTTLQSKRKDNTIVKATLQKRKDNYKIKDNSQNEKTTQ